MLAVTETIRSMLAELEHWGGPPLHPWGSPLSVAVRVMVTVPSSTPVMVATRGTPPMRTVATLESLVTLAQPIWSKSVSTSVIRESKRMSAELPSVRSKGGIGSNTATGGSLIG